MSIEPVTPSSHPILGLPLLLLPPIPPSIRVFSSESTLHMRWPKYWSFSFSIIPHLGTGGGGGELAHLGAAERSYPASEVSGGREELTHVRGQGR